MVHASGIGDGLRKKLILLLSPESRMVARVKVALIQFGPFAGSLGSKRFTCIGITTLVC